MQVRRPYRTVTPSGNLAVMRSPLSRRDLLRGSISAGVGVVAASHALAADGGAKPFRVAHLTDMHVQPERRAGDGYLAALQSLEKLQPAADLLVTGGDHVMDSTDQTLERCKTQWGVFHGAMAQSKLPVRHVLGNHDIFGWGVKETPKSTLGYGKALALDQLKLTRPYYSFDAGGWHFVVLDSMTRRELSYTGNLGAEQTEWLSADLHAAAGKPIIVFSHIPFLAVCVFFDAEPRIGKTEWTVPDAWMHHDAYAIVDLLDEHNVKLAVSGHIHLVDRCDYRGTTYICDGAVSGNWWKGPLAQFPEGYGVIDLYPDGRFEHQYVTYGWKAA